jgi:hypothetical protein
MQMRTTLPCRVLVLGVAAVSCPVAIAAAGDPMPSPYAVWLLNEFEGATAVDTAGGFHGAYLGGPLLAAAGPVDPCGDTAVLFDGVNDSVFVSGVGDALDIGEDSFTLIARYRKTDDNPRYMKIVNKGLTVSGTPSNAGYHLRVRDGIIEFSVSPGGEGVTVEGPEPDINVWHFVAGVFDRDAQTLRLHINPIDASPTTEVPIDPVGSVVTNIDFSIGSLNRTPHGAESEYFQGTIDEVRIYREALTGAQILSLATPILPCLPDLAEPEGVLDLADVLAFISAFQAQEPAADLAPPCGVFDLGDVSGFVTEFMLGCE